MNIKSSFRIETSLLITNNALSLSLSCVTFDSFYRAELCKYRAVWKNESTFSMESLDQRFKMNISTTNTTNWTTIIEFSGIIEPRTLELCRTILTESFNICYLIRKSSASREWLHLKRSHIFCTHENILKQ